MNRQLTDTNENRQFPHKFMFFRTYQNEPRFLEFRWTADQIVNDLRLTEERKLCTSHLEKYCKIRLTYVFRNDSFLKPYLKSQ